MWKRGTAKQKSKVFSFSCALRNVFLKSTQKDTNILIVRPTNCGKSSLLNPIELMFKVFVSPATAWYAWVGLDKCEVADLSDFRHTTEIIAAVTPCFCLSAKQRTCHGHRTSMQLICSYNDKAQFSFLLPTRNWWKSLENITSVRKENMSWCLYTGTHSILHMKQRMQKMFTLALAFLGKMC